MTKIIVLSEYGWTHFETEKATLSDIIEALGAVPGIHDVELRLNEKTLASEIAFTRE